MSQTSEPGQTDTRSVPILLVDDEASNLKLLIAVLRQAGYGQLISTTDPATVLALCGQYQFGVIILDLNMPGMNGYEILDLLQKDHSLDDKPEILVLTAMIQPEHLVRALEMGASDYLTKPFNPVELLARVRNLIMA